MIYLAIEENAGLGNQLFQYCHGYALAKKYNQDIHLISYLGRSDDIRAYMLDQLSLDRSVVKKITRVDRVNIFKGKNFKGSNALNRIYRNYLYKKYCKLCESGTLEKRSMPKGKNRVFIEDAVLVDGQDYYIEGFYESYKYFFEFEEEIRKQLKVKAALVDSEIKKWEDEIKSCNSVALHIRMGDFAACNRLFPIDYYDTAYQYLCRLLDNPIFYIFSEDESVKIHFENKRQDNIRIVTLNSKNKDMMEWHLLSQCHHHVITNSTYSWWSALAADYPDKRVFIPSKELYMQRENADIYLDGKTLYGDEHYDNYFLPYYEVIEIFDMSARS